MASLRNRFVFPLDYWSGAAFKQKRLNAGDIQVIFKRLRSTGYKFTQNLVVKPYSERLVATADQSAIRDMFANAWVNVRNVISDADQLAIAEAEYKKQYKYRTLRGYIFAREFASLRNEQP